MEKELDVRVGDWVRLKPFCIGRIDGDGDLWTECGEHVFLPSLVEAIIERPETDAEKVARLEQESANKDATIAELLKQLEAAKQQPEAPWYPPQVEGYGPWIEGPPPKWLTLPFQALTPVERLNRRFEAAALERALLWQKEAVAHCIKLDGAA